MEIIMDNIVTLTLIDHFNRTWEELKQAVKKTPAIEWVKGKSDYLIPARLAYHILFVTDMYTTDMGYEEYKPHRKYKLDWEATPADQLPTQEEIINLIDETAQTAVQWLNDLGEAGLLQEEKQYPWTGTCKLGRVIYTLRHNQWHIAEMNTLLRERGLESGDW
jgi:hypothetical protein